MSGQCGRGHSACFAVTRFAGFFLVILLTGGNTSSSDRHLLTDPNAFNQSSAEIPARNSSTLETNEDSQMFNQSVDAVTGGYVSSSEPPMDRLNSSMDNENVSETAGENTTQEKYPEFMRQYVEQFEEKLEPGKKVCSYQDILKHLNLTKHNDLFTMSRPVKNFSSVTYVYLEMAVAAILDVRETDQTLISYLWIYMAWDNKYIRWDRKEFCGMNNIIIPTDALWKPDVMIEEMIEKDKAPPSPYLQINYHGEVEYKNTQVVISTCKIHVYQFPFDIQKCNISFKSLVHSDDQIAFAVDTNTTVVTRWSRHVMETQYEWLFLKMEVSNKTENYSMGHNQTSTVYTIFMKRRSVLYIANFVLPVLFLLCLDLSSFLISDTSGEKLSFKVTVMLAVTLMQLILKDILPCSSDKIPLIAVFCIGVFSLMMLSLLETILIMYLMEKDSLPEDDTQNLKGHKPGKFTLCNCCRGKKAYSTCASINDISTDQTSSVAKEGSNSQLTEVSFALEKVSSELGQIEQTMSALSCVNDKEKVSRWARVARTINRVFITFYVLAATVFLTIIFTAWNIPGY